MDRSWTWLAADYNMLKGGVLPLRDAGPLDVAADCLEVMGIDMMTWMDWYNGLAKPSWTPAPATIGLIWQILYPLILVTFGFVFVQTFRRRIPWTVALPFAINLVANLLFMPVFSGLRSVPLAAVDILIVWATIIWMMVAIWPCYKWVAVSQVPYFVWVSLATLLQLSITAMNWGR